MAEVRRFVCDGCGAVKPDSVNYWRIIKITTGILTIYPWGHESGSHGQAVPLHCCGHECTIAKVSEFLGAKK